MTRGRQLGRPHDPAPRHAAGAVADEEAALARSRAVLFAARAKRVRPGRDDKVLADWNGLAIAALARAAAVFEPAGVAGARRGGAWISSWRRCRAPDGRVQHAWRLGRVTAAGLLDDQASMARAALALFEATGDAARLAQAVRLARAARGDIRATGTGDFTPRPTTRRTCRWRVRAPRRTTRRPRAMGCSPRSSRGCSASDRRYRVAGAGRGAAARVHRQARSARRPCRRCWPRPICWKKRPRW